MSHPPHITEYTVLIDEDPDGLSRKVEASIHDGWQPWNSLAIKPRADRFSAVFAQAMVRFAERF